MPIQTGTRLGPYEVTAFIGAGGMGEVYRARDSRLQRDVAIKVLPEGALDSEQRSRFEREAQAVAALSHPNVLAIFDTGSHEGRLYAVTELLHGQTLRERIREGPVPVRKAVEWAVQIARGLAAAHEKQLVHRDIKPENIFITTDGRVKILDFGLVKAALPAPDAAAETRAEATGAGLVLGTAGYMAPEQVRGQATDARTDLFAFGVVLYEMLSGARAFRRETVAETMTAILHDDPPELGPARSDVPPALERIVRHCMEKQPQERFQTARDVAFALEALSAATSAPIGTTAVPGTGGSPVARFAIVAAAAVVAVSLGWYAASKAGLLPSSGSVTTPAITLGAATQVTTDDGLEIDAALSPDGKFLAYSAGQATGMRIYIRTVAGGRTLTLSEGGAAIEYQPRWSPDGSHILFLTPEGAFVASSLGGAARRVAGGDNITSAAWAPDGKRVLLARSTRLSVVAAEGGAESTLVDGAQELHSCAWSPTNEWIACVSGNIFAAVPGLNLFNVAPSAIVLVPARGGPLATVADRTAANLGPVFSADGRYLYFVSNRAGPRDIYVMDLQGGIATPPPTTRVTTGLGVHSMSFDARNQRLAYVSYSARANIWWLPIPSGGAVDASAAKPITASSQVVESTRVSPDRKWLIYDSTLNLNADIFRVPFGGGTPERLTADPADEFAGDLSPDGREITYHSWRSGTRDIEVKAVDGGPAQVITNSPAQESYPRWSPDGSRIVFVDQAGLGSGVRARMSIVQRDASGRWSAPILLSDQISQGQVAWLSSDRIAFSTVRGIEAISLEPRPSELICALNVAAGDPEARTLVLSDDGRSLYFKSRDADGRSSIWVVPVSGGRPRLLVRFADPARPSDRGDFGAGGGRFFFTIEDRQADIWVAEVGKR